MEPDRARSRAFAAAREAGELIGVTTPVVGVSFFTALAEFDGLGLNATARRLIGLDETQTQWLGASAWEDGPYWDDDELPQFTCYRAQGCQAARDGPHHGVRVRR